MSRCPESRDPVLPGSEDSRQQNPIGLPVGEHGFNLEARLTSRGRMRQKRGQKIRSKTRKPGPTTDRDGTRMPPRKQN
eukprot:8206529-Pyramimonas_sp.AAC.1